MLMSRLASWLLQAWSYLLGYLKKRDPLLLFWHWPFASLDGEQSIILPQPNSQRERGEGDFEAGKCLQFFSHSQHDLPPNLCSLIWTAAERTIFANCSSCWGYREQANYRKDPQWRITHDYVAFVDFSSLGFLASLALELVNSFCQQDLLLSAKLKGLAVDFSCILEDRPKKQGPP